MQDQDSNTTGKVKVFLEDVLKIIDAEIADAIRDVQSFVNQENWDGALQAQAVNLSFRLLRIKIAEMKGADDATR